jgi:hypothetical protein
MMSKPKNRDGEYIPLDFEWENDPSVEYVRGHVTPSRAMDTLADEICNPECLDWMHLRYAYGRWSLDGSFEGRRLDIYDEPGRGRFKVTAIPYFRRYRLARGARMAGPRATVGQTVYCPEFKDDHLGILGPYGYAISPSGQMALARECYRDLAHYLRVRREQAKQTVTQQPVGVS